MNTYRQSPFANITPVVKNLIIINIIFYFATWILRAQFNLNELLSAHYFDSSLFRPWQIVTYMFMHDPKNPYHIIFNMLGLFVFGPILENTMGSKRFINFYFITGVGALLLNWGVEAVELHNLTGSFTPNVMEYIGTVPMVYQIYYGSMLGASGAIFGLAVAFAMLFPNVELFIMFIPIPVKAKYAVAGYIVFELVSGFGQFAGDSVAHFAHLGGALFGFIIVKIWGLNRSNNFFD